VTTWQCPRCSEELGELNGWCEYCKVKDGTIVYNPDKYFVREIRIRHITESVKMSEQKGLSNEELINSIESNERMTPQEKLHAKLFYHERLLVKDMDTLTIRAHREELAKIAFEARARLTAVDAEEDDRKKLNRKDKQPTGFERSLNTDDKTTDAINTIKKRVSKADKMRAGLERLGLSAEHVAEVMSARNISEQVNRAQNKTKPAETKESTPVFNPFAKKEESK